MSKQTYSKQYEPHLNLEGKVETDETKAGLISQIKFKSNQQQLGRCMLARKRLKHIFDMRKYYLSVIGLSGFEAFMVLSRVILETETLRVPPGNNQTRIMDAQLSLECISLILLTLFVIEIPFKMWAFGMNRWGRQLLYLIDSLVCAVCFSLNVYNIYRHVNRPEEIKLSPKLIALCGITQITVAANTASTFAEIAGLIIVYRLWYIKGYIKKLVTVKNKQYLKQINELIIQRDDANYRIGQLENMLQTNNQQKDYQRQRNNNNDNNNLGNKSFSRSGSKMIDPRNSRIQSNTEQY